MTRRNLSLPTRSLRCATALAEQPVFANALVEVCHRTC